MFSQFMPQQQFGGGYQFQQQFQQQQSAFQEVEGPESIGLIRMMPNSKAVFFDRHLDRFYAVSTDAAGTKAVDAYDFVKAQEPKQAQYLTVDEFNEWRSQYEQSIQQQQATYEPDAVRQAIQQPSAGPATRPANAPVGPNLSRPIQPGA